MIRLLIMVAVIIGFIFAMIFIAVPLFRGIGTGVGAIFKGIGWLLAHIGGFVVGMVRDTVRFVGALIACIFFVPFLCLNIVIGRWSASGHFFRSMKRECEIASACVYRILLRRPLRFLLLGGLLEGIEDRLDEAVAAAPPADKPSRQTGKFEGYKIIGSLPVGGSGAKLYIAEPNEQLRSRRVAMPTKVVIKAFALTDGSSLPQIVRESRALEAAKQLGLVLDHGMDDQRFFYVMPYHDGDHLSIAARQLHGESDGDGLARRQLATAMGFVEDLLLTLREYHRAGLWHKDVKPENIIIHDGRAHLVDLGLVTPLRSAMTLTTHGTEYFRDPEMVRQALRGVKVHQVDGAKFDIYAVGAVMYFLLENTFPAHGGLSRFGKKSPEALRWIVRRAMTEYNQRYSTVDQMLADIRFVRASADAAALKPVELPSMQGDAAQAEALRDVAAAAAEDAAARESEARAGSPRPKDEKTKQAEFTIGGMAFAAGMGPRGPFVNWSKVDEHGNPVSDKKSRPFKTKPRLRVVNWWTGAYVSDGEDHVYAANDNGPEPAPFVPTGVRRPAAEQRAAARARVTRVGRKAASRRARTFAVGVSRRHGSAQREPRAAVGLIALAAVITLVIVGVNRMDDRNVDSNALAVADSPMLAGIPGVESPWPLLVVNDHPAKANPIVADRIQRYLDDRADGWEFVTDDLDTEARVRSLLPTGDLNDGTTLATGKLTDVLRERNLLGVLYFSAGADGPEAPEDRLRVSFVMCQDGAYQKPMFVRTQTVNVFDTPAPEAFDAPPSMMPPIPPADAPVAVIPHTVTSTKHN